MGSMEKSIEAQAKIRQIAEEQNDVLKCFDSWEKSIKSRDEKLRNYDVNAFEKSESLTTTTGPADASVINKIAEEDERPPIPKTNRGNSSFCITPSLSTAPIVRAVSKVDVEPNVPTEVSPNSKEEVVNSERLQGNEFFDNQRFHEAIKSYTKSIMLNANSCAVYSNRGMFV